MDRKSFLAMLWLRGLRPGLLLVILFFSGRLLINVFKEGSTENLIATLLLAFAILYASLLLISFLTVKLGRGLYRLLPDSLKFWIRIVGKLFNFTIPIAFGAFVYHFWTIDWKIPALFIGIMLVERLNKIIREEKQARSIAKEK